MIYGILLALLILVSVLLVIFVLMQSDKGGGLAGTFGGIGGGGMPFSGREAATILTKLTTGFAIAFMAICILMSILSRNRARTGPGDSALQKRANQISSSAASSVLDQSILPPASDEAAPPTANQAAPPAEEGPITIPGVTGEGGAEKK
jgi:preprotein translocase subunit SecG